MIKNRLLALLASNARKGEFKAEGNVIYVYDVIVASDAEAAWFGGVSAESFVKALRAMSGDVEIRINSPGGDVFGAKAMAHAVREYAGTVTAHIDGYAASAASYLATSAESTIMAPGSMLMIHKAWTIALGNADEFKATAALLEKIDGTIAADYTASAARRGKDAPDFAALMAEETWFTPVEAIAAGLADEEAGENIESKICWDFSAYERVPSSLRVQAGSGQDEARTAGPRFDIGARVAPTVSPPHMPGQLAGEVREAVLTWVYGVLFDGMEEMGIHHWYVESELQAESGGVEQESAAKKPMKMQAADAANQTEEPAPPPEPAAADAAQTQDDEIERRSPDIASDLLLRPAA